MLGKLGGGAGGSDESLNVGERELVNEIAVHFQARYNTARDGEIDGRDPARWNLV
jgi:hypothetical protein